MKKITEKYYIGSRPKSLDENKMYVIAHTEGIYIASYTYSFEKEGWLRDMSYSFYKNAERVQDCLGGFTERVESNHDVAQRINAILNKEYRGFLYAEAYEMEYEEFDKFILIKKLMR
jgi:hypothetical protein